MLNTEILELLSLLKSENIEVQSQGDKIKVLAPSDISKELLEKISANKSDILNLLNSGLNYMPVLEQQEEGQFNKFPLTDVQQAYWIGRGTDFDMGNVATHIYYEFENENTDTALLEDCWNKLIQRHHMLRAVVDKDGMQRILETVPEYKIKILDLRSKNEEEQRQEIHALRDLLSHQVLPSEQWPLFELRFTLLKENMVRLHVSIDLLIADAFSCQILLKELSELYKQPNITLPRMDITFKDYIKYNEDMKGTEIYHASLNYWRNRLSGFPPAPQFKLKANPETIELPRFSRKSMILDRNDWSNFKSIAKKYKVTASTVLLTAYANILKSFSKTAHFAINLTLFNRPPMHQQINHIVGDFTSLNLLEINLKKVNTFLEEIQGIQARLSQDLDHKYVSGVQVMRELAKMEGSAKGITMPVIFTNELMNADEDMFKVSMNENAEKPMTIEVVGIGKQVYGISQTPQVWIDFQVGERSGALTYNWDIAEDLFDKKMIDTMFCSFHELLLKLASDETAWEESSGDLLNLDSVHHTHQSLVSEDEYKMTIQSLYKERLDQYLPKTAVAMNNMHISYQSLDQISNKGANWLRANDAQRNQLVGIVMNRGWEQIVAVLAVIKSGAAYLPVSADLPDERIQILLENGGVSLILMQSGIMKRGIIEDTYQCLYVDQLDSLRLDDSEPSRINEPDDLAYVIYTSGSTGMPKGVMITHESMINTVLDINKRFHVTEKDSILAVSALNFDLSVYDIFGMLLAGGTIVIPNQDEERDPNSWLNLMTQENVTMWNSVPALFEMLIEYVEGTKKDIPKALRTILMSGDWIPISLVKRIRKFTAEIELISLGGATEAAIWSIYHLIKDSDTEHSSIPYGVSLSNQNVYVMDESFYEKPVGVPGRILIGGAGLAVGYWKDTDKTKDSFVINPHTKERLYETGDWGYYLEDGTIIFMGREDIQIKLGGYRIELGEIESVTTHYPGIKSTVVLVKKENGKNKSLYGYYEKDKDAEVISENLLDYLHKQLPEYMIPTYFKSIDRIPLTVNGKIDRTAMIEDSVTILESVYMAPSTDIERELVEMLSLELNVQQVGVEDNFFELGGDSIAAIRLLLRIKNKYEVELSAKKIFEKPVVSDLAKEIALLTKAEEPSVSEVAIALINEELPQIIHREEQAYEPYPLTDLQQAYLVGRSDAVAFGNVACHTYEEIEVNHFKLGTFNRAWQKLINRHDVLQTVVNNDGTQVMLKDLPHYEIEYDDISEFTLEEKNKYLDQIRDTMSHQVMDIGKWPLFELKATKLDDEKTRLHISIDAIIADAWSVGILSRELCILYDDLEADPEPLIITYRDYVVGEIVLKETALYQKSLEYWREKLKTLEPAPDLPVINNPESVTQPKFKRRRKELNPNMWKRLKTNASKFGLTSSGIMMAAFSEVLTKWSYSSKFTLNVPQFNRLPMHKQVDELVGEFASFYLMSINNSEKDTFLDRARRIQGDLWQNMNHSIVSGVQMLREHTILHGGGATVSMPIVFTSTIGLLDQDNSPFDGFGNVVFSISQTPQVWLDCQVGEKGNTVIFNWDAIEDIFPDGMLDNMFEAYCILLDKLAEDEKNWSIEDMDLLPEMQRELIEETNHTYVPRKAELLQVAFYNQAVDNPDNLAVIGNDKTLTYHDLLLYADHIGQWLLEQGATRNTPVAIVMEKGWEQIAAVMGILNAGAAFVPIDIDMPTERIQYILDNSGIDIILSQSRLKDLLIYNKTLGYIDQFELDLTAKPVIMKNQKPDDLCYIIYTSGSTGRPKGVKISHENVDNMVYHTNKNLKITAADRVIAVTALHHDLSIYDVFGMLSAGGAIIMPEHSLKHDPEHLYNCMNKEQVTLWNSVPAIMDMYISQLIESKRRLNSELRQIILGGDWIPRALPDRIRSISDKPNILGIGGPTETTVWNIWYPIGEVETEWNSIPYGKPITNSKYYVMDENLRLRPVWVTGEMYCSGIQLSSGYYNDEEKTKQSFFLHPVTGERLYKTGDLGRYLPDGNLEFRGRADFQVKINGLRIELGEIESVVAQIPGIKTSVAAVIGENTAKKIVSFIVLDKENGVDTDNLALHNIITDPFERLEFKQQKRGIRKTEDRPYVELNKPEINEEYQQFYIDRRSYRRFVKEPITMEHFSELLSSMMYYNFDNLPFPKYRYASAGGLYPVQIYIYVKKDRVEGVSGGGYYYKPDENKLILMEADTELEGDIFPPGNKEIFDESAFTIFLVGNLNAIEPMYGPLTDNFCYIEAGIISQMLESVAISNQIGFCQIGNLDFQRLKGMFQLDNSYKYLHCMIGGGTDIYKDKYVALEEDWSGYKITDNMGDKQTEPSELVRNVLIEKLPPYMVPSKIVFLDKLPVTPNGKIDRKSLNESADITMDTEDTYIEPTTDIEKVLAELISNYVNIEKVGMNHNLFQLGADSLVAIQLSSQIRKVFQVEISLRELFTSQNVGDIAEKITELGGILNSDEIETVGMVEELPLLAMDLGNRYEPFPLTDVQEAYWVGRNSFIELGNISTHVYLEIEQRNLDIDRFERAWEKMIKRHEMLRAIIRNDGQQQILKEIPYYVIDRIDLKDAEPTTRIMELRKIRDRMSHQILKADEWPLFEIKASILDEEKIRLHVSIDLLISDVWSARITTRELMALYNEEAELPPLTLSFRDYVIAEKSLETTDLYKKSWDYWQERIKTLPPAPDLPLAKNPASLDKPTFERRVTTIEQEYWDQLKAKANKLGVTHSGLLTAAYVEVLAMWSSSPHFTLNLTLFNRLPFDKQVNEIVGDFTSLILLEINNDVNDSFENRIIRIQEQILADMDHRYVSGVKVIRELTKQNNEGLRAAMPVVFTSTLNLGASEYPSGSLDDGDDVYGISQTPQIWLDHVVSEQDRQLVINWDAIEELFPDSMLDNMFECYCNLLYRLAKDENAWLLPMSELISLPRHYNRNETISVQNQTEGIGQTLHGLFNQKAMVQPDNIAVISTSRTITYAELNKMSNQIGSWMQENNQNELVAVIMEKGWEQVVAVLGILQSGYAYLPIACELPRERIEYLLQNSQVTTVLSQSWLKLNLTKELNILYVDQKEELGRYSTSCSATEQKPEDLAYVIYTSGSTGLPKGVAVNHKGAVNTILDINRRFKVTAKDRVFALSELNFDLSVYDIFGTLAAGGTIVLPEANDKKNPDSWMRYMSKEDVTVWNSVPALMEMLVEYASGSGFDLPKSLRLVLLSGDWIPVELPLRLRNFNDQIEVISLGGATEASIWSVFYPIGEVSRDWKSIPYGKALSGQTIYVLDDCFGMRPDWVSGQIYIGGVGLAMCYWKEKELTKEKFIVNPLTGEKLYATGDIGRYLPDGNIEFLGRTDNQVKIQGYRIELGEIESVMSAYPFIKNSVVIADLNQDNMKSLIGYYTMDQTVLAQNKRSSNPLLDGAKYKAVMDPVERLKFKISAKGIRKDLTKGKRIQLSLNKMNEKLRDLNLTRRSYRSFLEDEIENSNMATLLHTLSKIKMEGLPLPKLRYGSAGSLYPIQIYLYIKENRVASIENGFYYYNPENSSLVEISKEFRIASDFYPYGNREIYETSAFSVFFVANTEAIKPMYGENAMAFCLLETGIISQLLEMEAPKLGIGLCQIGSLDYKSIEQAFEFNEEHILLHNILGGKITVEDTSLYKLQKDSEELNMLVDLLKSSDLTESELTLEGDLLLGNLMETKRERVTVTNPMDRAKFKFFNKGIRSDVSKRATIQLINAEDTQFDEFVKRRSIRQFAEGEITLEELGGLFGSLMLEKIDGVPLLKGRYASAGTLHPVQSYVYIKQGKIQGIDEGIYYYNPVQHSLEEILSGGRIESNMFPSGNKEIFDSCGFAIFMVAQSRAITPLYPKQAYEFCMIEAGEMSQLLEMNSFEQNIGLCQIGSFRFDKISQRFKLDDGHTYLHCILGGKITEEMKMADAMKKNASDYDEQVSEDTKLVEYDNDYSMSEVGAIQEFLNQKLPKYMVPNLLIELDKFPLTANGKIDRKHLPKTGTISTIFIKEAHAFIPPNTELEKDLAEIWCDIIGAKNIGINDNFFDLGGNSMHLVKAFNRIKEEIWDELQITELFEYPTIHSLSTYLSKTSVDENKDGEERGMARAMRRERRRQVDNQ